jgi:hypothetical protein
MRHTLVAAPHKFRRWLSGGEGLVDGVDVEVVGIEGAADPVEEYFVLLVLGVGDRGEVGRLDGRSGSAGRWSQVMVAPFWVWRATMLMVAE